MLLNAGCTMTFDCSAPVPMILMLRPRSGLGHWIAREAYTLEPFVPATEYTDGHGNLCQRVVTPLGPFSIGVECTAETAEIIDVALGAPFVPVQNLPADVLEFLLPSRYAPADKLIALAQEVVAGATPGYDQAEAIRAWINANIEYRYGTSDATTSAVETADNRVGVCRDFVHLGLSLCRAISIPARMVVGWLYQLDPMDLHAWFEAYVGGRWYTFDATQTEPRGGRIAIAYGRDAADVAMTTQFGPALLTGMKVWVEQPERVKR